MASTTLGSSLDHQPMDPGQTSPAVDTRGLVDPRVTLALDLSSLLAVVVMGPLGIVGMTSGWSRLLGAAFCIGYGATDLAGSRTRVGRNHQALILGLQTVLVAGMLALHTEFQDAFAFLFVPLSMRAVLAFGLRRGAPWIVAFWLISSGAAVWVHGIEGLFNAVFNLAVYPLCGMVGAALAALARSTAERSAALTELRAAQQQLNRLAVDAERRRLGRDLHDSVKQQVFAAIMQVGAARALLPRQPERALTAIGGAEDAARRAGAELNLVIHELRSDDLDHGLSVALRKLADTWGEQNGIRVDCRLPDYMYASFGISSAVLRVAQEALANTARHASAARVSVRLAQSPTELELIIIDDGRGFDPSGSSPGVGLDSMAERMAGLGGRLSIDSTPGRGCTIRAMLPLGVDLHG